MTTSQQGQSVRYDSSTSQPPAGAPRASWLATQRGKILAFVSGQAARIRNGFDREDIEGAEEAAKATASSEPGIRATINPLLWIAVQGGLAWAAWAWTTHGLSGSCDISLIRLEVTFSASRFAELLGVLPNECRARVAGSFMRDLVFCLFYPFVLSTLYVWTERWRRFDYREDAYDAPTRAALPTLHDFILIAPFLAALLDAVAEDFPLWRATHAIPAGGGPIPASAELWVWLGSAGAALKWMILFLFAYGLLVELLSGPRGVILRRLKFGVLALALGALPLLATAPGQDILQRGAEGEHRLAQTIAGVLAVAFAGTAVWYCGRKLVQLEFERADATPDEKEARPQLANERLWRAQPWYTYFAEQLPRMMGIVVLVIAGAAFARAGLALVRYGIVMAVCAFAMLVFAIANQALYPGERRGAPGAHGAVLVMRAFETVVGSVLGVGMLLPFTFRIFGRGALDEATREQVFLCTGAWACIAAAWTLYFWVYHRREIASARSKASPESAERPVAAPVGGIDANAIPRDLRRKFWIAAAVSLACLVVLAASPVSLGRRLGPLSILAIFTANTVFLGSVMVWIFARYRVPIVRIGLGLAVLFGLWNENHDVRPVKDARPELVARRPTIEQHFAQWIAARRSADAGTIPIVLVAAAGGGLRASYWTAAALAAAQDRDSSFVRHVFAISGVSGGSLGAAMFTALARDAAGRADTLPCAREQTSDSGSTGAVAGAYTRCVRRFMGDDFLSPVLSMMVAPDLAQRFLPMSIQSFDRSRGLEDSWIASYRDATGKNTMEEGLLALTPDSVSQVNLPSLFLNSTHVESGRRYIAASVRTEPSLLDQRDVIGLLDSDLPLASAVHNSARFTYVSPAGHLTKHDGREYGRVVDGGYFENSGLETLGGIWTALGSSVGSDVTIQPVVLYLCNDPLPCVGESNGDAAATTKITSVNETLAPLRAVLAARSARGSLARAEIMKIPRVTYLQLNVCDNLTRSTAAASGADTTKRELSRERVVSPPLSWLLSGLARDWMNASLTAGADPRGASCQARNAQSLELLHTLLEATRR